MNQRCHSRAIRSNCEVVLLQRQLKGDENRNRTTRYDLKEKGRATTVGYSFEPKDVSLITHWTHPTAVDRDCS